MTKQIRSHAIVLRRTNYGEADRILQIITPENGCLSVMARGVRREKSRLAGGIELFAICDVVIHEGRGELGTLTGAKLDKFFDQIMTDYDRLRFGYEAIKHVARAAQMIDDAQFYELLKTTMESLNDTNILLKITEIWFYLQLADLMGNGLNTATDNNGMKLVEDAQYNFDVNEQVFVHHETGRFDSRTIKLLRIMTTNQPNVVAKIKGTRPMMPLCLELAKTVAKI